MCGIAGYFNTRAMRSQNEVAAFVGRANDAMIHRGPDAEGMWTSADGRCTLGHRRLSIIDLSASANQPMLAIEGRYAITFNGEIYNYQELRAELEAKGQVFETASDTEVMLKAFIAMGPEAFSRFDGQFAAAIYDGERRELTLVRDRAGEKPLYIVDQKDYIAFASELRPLLQAPDFDAKLSPRAVALYFALRYVPPPFSIAENILKLEPGTYVKFDANGSSTKKRYFAFPLKDDIPQNQPSGLGYLDQVESALEDSLRVRLHSDVPIGAFLSSGIDSSLVCALLVKRMKKDIKTYTVGFAGDEGSEHVAARAIAAALGTDHHDYIFGPAEFDRICDDIGRLLDEPNGDRSCVPTYLLSQFARQHVTVAISGDGGDELYSGYGRYFAFIQKFGNANWKSYADVAAAYFQNALPVMPWATIQTALPDGFPELIRFAEYYGNLFTVRGRPLLHSLRLLDFESYMPGAVLAKVDRMSMRHSLEVRTPYLAPALYDLSGRASIGDCVDGGLQKATLRKIAARYLSDTFVRLPKKGFGMPSSVFLQSKERVQSELARSFEILSQTEFFKARPGSAMNLIQGRGNNINAIWAIIVLARWIESTGVRF